MYFILSFGVKALVGRLGLFVCVVWDLSGVLSNSVSWSKIVCYVLESRVA